MRNDTSSGIRFFHSWRINISKFNICKAKKILTNKIKKPKKFFRIFVLRTIKYKIFENHGSQVFLSNQPQNKASRPIEYLLNLSLGLSYIQFISLLVS